MTHDFKAALSELPTGNDFNNHVGHESQEFLEIYGNDIAAALRIADKLMQKPSDEMIKHAINATTYEPCVDYVFEAMRDQMLKEIDIEHNKYCGIKILSSDKVSENQAVLMNPADTSQNIEHEPVKSQFGMW